MCVYIKKANNLTSVPTAVGSVFDKRYRFGFNGMEIDKGEEGMGGGGSTYDYGFRIYNPSLGKFLSVDPLSASYPWYTPYQFAGNKPINCIDLDGLEEIDKELTSPSSTFVVTASITISMTYMIVTDGRGSVNNINTTKFNERYKKGNTRMFLAQLPGPNTEPLELEGKAHRLAKRAHYNKSEKAIDKLKKMGYYNVYVADIQYNYTVIQNPNTTLEAALTWMNENKQGRGLIMSFIPKENMNESDGKNLNIFMDEASLAKNDFEGIGSNEGVTFGKEKITMIDNYVVIFPDKHKGENHLLNTVIHETGHNAAKNHWHGNNYEYDQEGLQHSSCEDNTKLYPTKSNTISILKDKSNRATIKEK